MFNGVSPLVINITTFYLTLIEVSQDLLSVLEYWKLLKNYQICVCVFVYLSVQQYIVSINGVIKRGRSHYTAGKSILTN